MSHRLCVWELGSKQIKRTPLLFHTKNPIFVAQDSSRIQCTSCSGLITLALWSVQKCSPFQTKRFNVWTSRSFNRYQSNAFRSVSLRNFLRQTKSLGIVLVLDFEMCDEKFGEEGLSFDPHNSVRLIPSGISQALKRTPMVGSLPQTSLSRHHVVSDSNLWDNAMGTVKSNRGETLTGLHGLPQKAQNRTTL